MSDLYQRLGVSKNASPDEIKKAYRDLARQHHPDKGGDAEKFKSIQEAAEVLSDENKRREYDNRGQAPFPMQGGMPFPPDFFSMFGGINTGPMFHQQQPRRPGGKGPSNQIDVNLKLENFYRGFEFNLNFKQARKCGDCAGSFTKCDGCGGSGMRMIRQQMGNMIINTQGPCDKCDGRGEKSTSSCSTCNGRRLLEKDRTLSTKLQPGMRDGERVVFEGECSATLEHDIPGDLVLVVHLESSRYEWKENDLYYRHTISYAESILGFEFTLTDHPSGNSPTFVWKSSPIIRGAVLSISGEGMPRKGGGFGSLHVSIDIVPPVATSWDTETQQKLEDVFGKVNLSKTDAKVLTYSKTT